MLAATLPAPPQHAALLLDAQHERRRLRGDALHGASDEVVEHHIADDEQPEVRECVDQQAVRILALQVFRRRGGCTPGGYAGAMADGLVVVTGAGGFIGSNVVGALAARGADVIACDPFAHDQSWRYLAPWRLHDVVGPRSCWTGCIAGAGMWRRSSTWGRSPRQPRPTCARSSDPTFA